MQPDTDDRAPTLRRLVLRKTALAVSAAIVALAATGMLFNERLRRQELARLEADRLQLSPAPGARVGAPFELQDLQGHSFGSADLAGAPALLIFGADTDVDALRGHLQVVSEAIALLRAARSDAGRRLQPVFIARDDLPASIARSRTLLDGLAVPWRGLTGPRAAVDELARAYFVPGSSTAPARKGLPPSAGTTAYLLGPDGHFVRHVVVPADPTRLADWLRHNL